jgi:hypothetical protein
MAVNTNTVEGIAKASAPKTPKLTPAQTAAATKATKIATSEDNAVTAYQSSLTATPKTAAEIAALNDVVAQTVAAINAGSALPGVSRTGVPAQPTPASTWDGTKWITPGGVTGSGVGTTTARAVLEMYLRDAGIPDSIMASSVSYLEALDEAGIKDQQTLIDLYMNNKTFTAKSGAVLNSPFYQKFTSITEGLVNPATGQPYSAKESFAWRLGMEAKVSQYGYSPLFVSDDSLKKFAKNGVSVDNLEKRMQAADLASSVADPNKVAALQKMGFINANQGVKDFYLNNEIGQKQFEENARVGAFATENLRFANKGINFDAARIKQVTDMYGNTSETSAADAANKLYSGVAENLQQTVALAGMYDKTGKTGAQEATGVQTELENELLLATPSDRRKRVAEANQRAFEGKAGLAQGALGTRSTTGLI